MGIGDHSHECATLRPGKRSGTHCIGGWVGPSNGLGLEGCGQCSPPPGFDPRTVNSIASCYNDDAFPVLYMV